MARRHTSGNLPSLPSPCVPSSCGACPCPPAPVGVVALSTLLATTVQRAPGLLRSGVEAAHLSGQQPVCATRPGLGLPRTHLSALPFLRPGARKQPTPNFSPAPAAAFCPCACPRPGCARRGAYVYRWSGLLCAEASFAFAGSLTSSPSPGLSNLG